MWWWPQVLVRQPAAVHGQWRLEGRYPWRPPSTMLGTSTGTITAPTWISAPTKMAGPLSVAVSLTAGLDLHLLYVF
jgi:hypothetical protein